MKFKANEIYKLLIEKQGKGTKERIFKGKLLQETSKLITLKGERYTESFLKADIGREIKFI